MWGVFPGVAFGAASYFLSAAFIANIAKFSGYWQAAIGVMALLKFVLLYLMLYALAIVSTTIMLFAAGGYLITLLGLAIIRKNIKPVKKPSVADIGENDGV